MLDVPVMVEVVLLLLLLLLLLRVRGEVVERMLRVELVMLPCLNRPCPCNSSGAASASQEKESAVGGAALGDLAVA